MDYDKLSEELKEKARNCKTPDEIFALAKEEGYELSMEDLEPISGGAWCDKCSDYSDYCKVVCSSTSVAPGPSAIM